MRHMIIALLSLWLSLFSLASAADSKNKIAKAQGREKLGLLLQFLQGSEHAVDKEKSGQLLDGYAREALALSKQFHDRHAEGTARKYVAHTEHLSQRYEQALEGYFQSRRLFRELGDRKDEDAINRKIDDLFSIVFYVFSDFGRTGEYYKNSLSLSRLDWDWGGIRKSLNGMADTYRYQGDFQKAIPLYREALQLGDRHHILFDSGGILSNLSEVYLKLGNFAESTKYMQQALVFSKMKRQTLGNGRTFLKKGSLSLLQNDFPQALGYLRQALEIHKRFSETAKTAVDLDRLGQLHSRFKQDAKAQEYFQQALALRQQLSDQTEIIQTILAQAAALQKQHDLPKAEALLWFCENKARQNQLREKLSETYLQLSSLYALRNDSVNALYYQTLGKKAKDGLPSTAILAGIQKLIAKSETEKEINKLEIQKHRQTVIAMLAIFLLLILIGLLGWKQKSIKRWARNHLFIKDQQLQEKKAQLLGMQQKLGALQEKQSRSKYETSHMSMDRGKECLQLVLRHMQQDKLFLDGELTLKKLAAKVGANTSYLSQVINEQLGMGFSDFVNHFRIEEAKKIMLADDKNEWDVIDICFEVGFNSLSSFYRIFKVHSGTTPVEFQRACHNDN